MLGQPTDISGSPQDFSSSDWVWGGAATFGMTYFVDRSWFVDVNYTMSMTLDGATPSDPSYVGDLIGDASGTFTTHTIALSINRAF